MYETIQELKAKFGNDIVERMIDQFEDEQDVFFFFHEDYIGKIENFVDYQISRDNYLAHYLLEIGCSEDDIYNTLTLNSIYDEFCEKDGTHYAYGSNFERWMNREITINLYKNGEVHDKLHNYSRND